MKKAISFLTSAVLAVAIAVPAFAEGDLAVTQGTYEMNIQKSNGMSAEDTAFDQRLNIDIKGNVNDSFTLEGRITFQKNSFSLRSTKFNDFMTFDKISIVDYIIQQKSKIGSVDMIYDVRSFEADNGSFNGSSHDPLGYFDPQAQKIGKGQINFEAKASYKDTASGRFGLVSGTDGRWYVEANTDVTPELKVGFFHNVLYSGGIRDNENASKPTYAGFVGTTYATYKPKDIDGLTINAAGYFSRTPGPNAISSGNIVAGPDIEVTAAMLDARGIPSKDVLGKNYVFAWRGNYNGWTYGGNWNSYSVANDLVLFTERDGKLYLKRQDLIDHATSTPTWEQMGKIVVFNTTGQRVNDSSADHPLNVFTLDPEGDKVSGGAAYVDANYVKGSLNTTFSYKNTSQSFGVMNGNFYKYDKLVYGKDEQREESNLPVLIPAIENSTLHNRLYLSGEKAKSFTKYASNTTYQFNDNITAELFMSARERKNATISYATNGNTHALNIDKIYYKNIKPRVTITGIADIFDIDATLDYEMIKESNITSPTSLANSYTLTSDGSRTISEIKGSILGYKIETTAINPVKYIDRVKANYRSVEINYDNEPTGIESIDYFFQDNDDQKLMNQKELYLEAATEEINDFKFLSYYRLEGRPLDSRKIDWYRSSTAGQVQYYGVQNLEVRLKDLYVYDQTKRGSDRNWVIGSAKYSIKDTLYSFANDTTIRLLGKYNTIEENDGTNKSSMYFEILKSMPSSSIMFRYGILSDDYTDFKNLDGWGDNERFENNYRLEYRKNF